MQEIEAGNFAVRRWALCAPASIRVVSWNINRGLKLAAILEFLAAAKADVVLLQESDLNARRTHHLNIAKEISRKLEMNYIFGREFEELTQGSRVSPAYHGQSTLARWPLSNARIIRFRQQSNFWHPHWFLPDIAPLQERRGGRMALASDADIAGKTIATYNLHLESRGNDEMRRSQLTEVLGDAARCDREMPVVLGGDFNFDIAEGAASMEMNRADFHDAFDKRHMPTTPHSFFERGRVIDGIFTRGRVVASEAEVHRSVSASDHYPLSVKLSFG
jgi:endonuclease/exonuclease/phosphatase family metal-dependent hydrolase